MCSTGVLYLFYNINNVYPYRNVTQIVLLLVKYVPACFMLCKHSGFVLFCSDKFI